MGKVLSSPANQLCPDWAGGAELFPLAQGGPDKPGLSSRGEAEEEPRGEEGAAAQHKQCLLLKPETREALLSPMAPGHPGTAGEEPLFSPFREILVRDSLGCASQRSSSVEGPQCRMHPGMIPCKPLSPSYLKPPAPNPTFLAKFPAINSF